MGRIRSRGRRTEGWKMSETFRSESQEGGCGEVFDASDSALRISDASNSAGAEPWNAEGYLDDAEALCLLAGRDSGVRPELSRRGYRAAKRVFDVVFSLIVLATAVLFFPLTFAVLGIGALQCRSNPFYLQERIGQAGRSFRLVKLRTMVGDADNVERYLDADQLARWRTERKVDDDPRITRIGHFLRKTSLDEVPQFVNVLIGQMSVVGPRPVVLDELSNFSMDQQAELLSVQPGITGWWQVTDRNDATWENGRRQKLELYYVRNAGIRFDAEVLFRTFSVMFGKRKTGR